MYFKSFPSIYYEYNVGGQLELRVVTDVTANVRLRKEVLDAVAVYETYDIKDGETPEIIAAKYYGDSNYHWAIMMANEKYNHLYDFPMPLQILNEYIVLKYNKFFATEWTYETTAKNQVTTTTVTATIPNHGIPLDYSDTISIENAFVVQTDQISQALLSGQQVTSSIKNVNGTPVTPEASTTSSAYGKSSIKPATGLAGDLVVTAVTEDTISFKAAGAITGVPSGGFSLYTKNLEYRTHHHELNGYVVNSDVVDATAVTYYDYETKTNDAKRRIKLITPKVMAIIGNELKTLIK